MVVDGETAEEWVIDVALVNAGATNFELIQPVSGSVDLYRSAIRPGAPATFHHVGYRIPDFDEATEIIAATGKTWAQYGEMKGGLRFGYVDMTAELGHYVELMDLEPGGEKHFASLEAQVEQPLTRQPGDTPPESPRGRRRESTAPAAATSAGSTNAAATASPGGQSRPSPSATIAPAAPVPRATPRLSVSCSDDGRRADLGLGHAAQRELGVRRIGEPHPEAAERRSRRGSTRTAAVGDRRHGDERDARSEQQEPGPHEPGLAHPADAALLHPRRRRPRHGRHGDGHAAGEARRAPPVGQGERDERVGGEEGERQHAAGGDHGRKSRRAAQRARRCQPAQRPDADERAGDAAGHEQPRDWP